MAYKLIWSPAARDDLHDIVTFIARDNPNRAMSFGYELISETDRLKDLPESVASCLNIGTTRFARSFFAHTESYTESVTRKSFVRLRVFGIPREEFCSYKKARTCEHRDKNSQHFSQKSFELRKRGTHLIDHDRFESLHHWCDITLPRTARNVM
jgi:plasmid stabilization system protein ParE